jgi:hypothetical protein
MDVATVLGHHVVTQYKSPVNKNCPSRAKRLSWPLHLAGSLIQQTALFG